VSAYAADKGNTWNDSFNKAKKVLEREVYADHRISFYCGCGFDEDKQLRACQSYTPKSPGERSKRIEWDHIVPAAHFGQSFEEWRNGHSECVDNKGKSFKGRNCASKVNMTYRYMESDMYNLVPAIGELNGLRSDYRFGMLEGEKREFGACDIEIDAQTRRVEPPESVRGDIARIYEYMNRAYGHGIIGESSEKLFDAWDKQDPVDAWECERCSRIESIQGNENPFVKEACQKAGLWTVSFRKNTPSQSSEKKPRVAVPSQDNGVYHGNKKSKVFHAPGCRDYDCKNCTDVFKSQEEALKAGYRPHKQCGK
jgi:deoxyribonuclease-1